MPMVTVGQIRPTHSPQNPPNGMTQMAMALEMNLRGIRQTSAHRNTVYRIKIDLAAKIQMGMAGRI